LRVGILGGVFNPPHIGHLICAQEALLQLELETVLFMPVGQAPHRGVEEDPGAEVRVEMCERAVAGDERLEVSRLEVEREGPSYTVDTLRQWRERSPDDEIFWLMGGDQAASLPSWREPEEVLSLATIAVVERTGWHREEVVIRLARLKGGARVVFFDMPRIDVSSSMVRRRVARGKPIRYLVPDAVAELVAERGLYGASPVGAE
jgi:nicotinate-nucleotide adenylyltransferase